MNFLLYLFGMFIGYIITSFGITTILICLRVGIPFCNNQIKNKDLYCNGAINLRKKYIFAIIFWSIISLITTLLCTLSTTILIGFIIGFVLCIIPAITQSGANENNISEVVNSLKANNF